VFTTLYLKDISRMPDQPVADAILKRGSQKDGMIGDEKKEQIPIQATEAVINLKRLVILGGPGSGKSTLINHIAAKSAANRLKHGASKALPVMIILRRFAAEIPEDCKKGDQELIWEYLGKLLQKMGCRDFLSSLKLEIDKRGGIIFFDGLDEVRESDEDKRSLILDAIQDFAGSFGKCRIVITCREYAYRPENKAWQLPEIQFPAVKLDVFRSEQIRIFTRIWYKITGKWKGWDESRRLKEADDLCQAVESQPHLKELAESPLLLTLMAQVHGRDGYLPKDRADLYERAVNLLLAHWEYRIDRETCKPEEGNVPTLGIRTDALRSALERVALSVHERQEKEKGDRTKCADISKADLREELAEELDNDFNKAEKVIEYIQNRAGLLLAHGKIFTFPHRTFQEFLTATGIMRREADPEGFLQERISRDQSWWQEVFLLAAGSCKKTASMTYNLINALLQYYPDKTEITSEIAGFARLAAQAMNETDFLKHVQADKKSKPGRFSEIHERVQGWLMAAMTADKVLTPQERCDAGNALNWVGDPRFNPDRWYLPKDDDGFVEIPAGSFMMGSDKDRDKDALDREFPRHKVTLSVYLIGRYPVTVAQYRAFLDDIKQPIEELWKEYNRYDNHPVARVSWEDADAYCKWLSKKLDCQIQLPTEAQWEYAARGTDRRIYPWEDEVDPNKANYNDTGINTTSPVGCFPSGNSPYGLSDMAGNVWEWCYDRYGEYTADAVTDPVATDNCSGRVLRGGSWYYFARFCRTANRNYNSPINRNYYHGFRLVRSPKVSRLANRQAAAEACRSKSGDKSHDKQK
jgi:formylglycine-generating enzyme required for sulfatase activity